MRAPPRQARRHRRGFSTTTTARAGPPSMGSTTTSQPQRTSVMQACSTRIASAQHPCRLPKSVRAPSRTHRSRHTTSRLRTSLFSEAHAHEKDASRPFLQPTYDTSTHVSGPSIPGASRDLRLAAKTASPPASRRAARVALRLTAKPPASAFVIRSPTAQRETRGLSGLSVERRRSFLAGLRIDSPSGDALVEGVVFPRSSR